MYIKMENVIKIKLKYRQGFKHNYAKDAHTLYRLIEGKDNVA